MTKILNFALKIKGGRREDGTCDLKRAPGLFRIKQVQWMDKFDVCHGRIVEMNFTW